MRFLHLFSLGLLFVSGCSSCKEEPSVKAGKAPATSISQHEYWAYNWLKSQGLGHACTHPLHGPCEDTENQAVHFKIRNLSVHSYSGKVCCTAEGKCKAKVNIRYFKEGERYPNSLDKDPWCDSQYERMKRFRDSLKDNEREFETLTSNVRRNKKS